MKKLAVVALGGNALLKSGQKGTVEEQTENVATACNQVADLLDLGYNIVIAHGNGPQVGNVMLQHEGGFNEFGIPKQPMDICVAETQGSIAYMIEQQMHNVLAKRGVKKNIISLITQVIVDKNDPAFKNPTKPVGPYYTPEVKDELVAKQGWQFKEDKARGGWRRVVASPKPVEINNIDIVETLTRQGNIVVTVGGGGIPAIKNADGSLQGVESVIDKDLASSTLASKINADAFFILTDVSNVMVNFNTPEQEKLGVISIPEINKHLADGQFTEGSMAPKVRAGIQFVENGGKQTIITEASLLKDADAVTRIVK